MRIQEKLQLSLRRKAYSTQEVDHLRTELFQKIMECIMTGYESCLNLIDEIIGSGVRKEERDESMKKLLAPLRKHGVTLNGEECSFDTQKWKFLRCKQLELHPRQKK